MHATGFPPLAEPQGAVGWKGSWCVDQADSPSARWLQQSSADATLSVGTWSVFCGAASCATLGRTGCPQQYSALCSSCETLSVPVLGARFFFRIGLFMNRVLSLLISGSLSDYRAEWFSNVRADLLAGLTVALALIPEAIAFSLLAGLAPAVGLYASFIIAVTTAFLGGRPGMISAATGAMALLMFDLVHDYGLEYLLAATVLTGVLQVLFRTMKLGRYMKFIPRAVMTGFVNALAILIFMAQLPAFRGAGWEMYALVAGGLVIIYGLPRLTKVIPSALAAIVVLSGVSIAMGLPVQTIGDLGPLPTMLPSFHIPMVPWNMETLAIIFPVSLAMSIVGIVESLLTAAVVDDATDTVSCRHRETQGQGIANIVAGFFGGMAGCAMIGQSVINVQSGGRGRLSTFTAGILLMVLILGLGSLVARIPMGALVAVMIAVSVGTFDWSSIRDVRRLPVTETLVMIVTVSVVLYTHDLAKGVFAGVLFSALLFARQVAKFVVITRHATDGHDTYTVQGELFFVSVEEFRDRMRHAPDVDRLTIDFRDAHIWDASAVGAIDAVVLKLRARGIDVQLEGLNEASASIIDRLAVHDRPELQRANSH